MTKRTSFIRIIHTFFLFIFFVIGSIGVFSPLSSGRAQNSSSGQIGLQQGEQDTLRLDLRVKGSEEKDIDSSIGDQKIGAAHKTIRAERKEKELLRVEEETAEKERRAARIEEIDTRIEKRKREDDRVRQKKTKIYRSTN